jgi:DnaJ-class molecular chaperone
VRAPAGACRLLVDSGSLRVAPDDPLAGANEEDAADLESLVALLAATTSDGLRFTSTPTAAGTGRALPAARILMDAAVRGRERAQLWSLVGGRPVSLRMAGGSKLAIEALAALDPAAQALLTRLVKARPAAELVDDRDSGLDTLRVLARLRVDGLVAPVAGTAEDTGGGLSSSSRDLFLRRIEREIERRPLRLNRDDHRKKLTEMLRNLGVVTHYQLLGVERHADERAIHQAYVDVGRHVHPLHAATLGLDDKAAALELLFERATEAYLVLSHPDRRRAYDRDLPAEEGGPASEERRREKANVAREMYARARRMAMEHEFQAVMELMQQAVQLDPQAEYYALLGDVQRRNPQWHAGALQSYREAVRCRSNDADLRLSFAQVLEELGDRKQAEVQYRAALELRPGDEKLQEAFAEFEQGAKKKKKKGGDAKTSKRAPEKSVKARIEFDFDEAGFDGEDRKESRKKSDDDDDGGMFPTFTKLFRRKK